MPRTAVAIKKERPVKPTQTPRAAAAAAAAAAATATAPSRRHNNNTSSAAASAAIEVCESKSSSSAESASSSESVPARTRSGTIVFPDFPHFQPNMTPKEVLHAGSFGGTYFRPIYSSVAKRHYTDEAWRELPPDWLQGIADPARMVTSDVYRATVNRYRVGCGSGLDDWESSGWIRAQDPYGWFQWYCRFYRGRRSDDDDRQVRRGLGVMGPTGRFRRMLVNKILARADEIQAQGGVEVPNGPVKCEERGTGGRGSSSSSGGSGGTHRDMSRRAALLAALADDSISPKVRQLLMHWGYQVTEQDVGL